MAVSATKVAPLVSVGVLLHVFPVIMLKCALGAELCARSIDGIPLQFHLSPRPSVRNNAFGVTPCIVASWLLCRLLKQQVKIEYSCLGLCYKIAKGRVLERFHVPKRHRVCGRAGYIVSMCAFGRLRAAATIFVRAELRLITFVARMDFVQSPRVCANGCCG